MKSALEQRPTPPRRKARTVSLALVLVSAIIAAVAVRYAVLPPLAENLRIVFAAKWLAGAMFLAAVVAALMGFQLRFRLRTMLIALAVLSVPFGWYAYRVLPQQRAVARCHAAGAYVHYALDPKNAGFYPLMILFGSDVFLDTHMVLFMHNAPERAEEVRKDAFMSLKGMRGLACVQVFPNWRSTPDWIGGVAQIKDLQELRIYWELNSEEREQLVRVMPSQVLVYEQDSNVPTLGVNPIRD